MVGGGVGESIIHCE